MSFVERIRGKLKKRAATKHQLVVSGHNEEICPLKDDITKMESERDVVIKAVRRAPSQDHSSRAISPAA